MARNAIESDINFVGPRNSIIVAGDLWEDDGITDIDYTSAENADGGTLDPGESLTAAEIVTTRDREYVAVRAGATTSHGADIDGDGREESIIRYVYEVKIDNAEDTYHSLPGMSSTLSLGRMGEPEEFVPGSYIGPVKAFRVLFENRSDGFSNPTSVPVDAIGTHVHGRVLRPGLEMLQPIYDENGGD